MTADSIDEVRIDAEGRLLVYPHSARFPYVYREAMEVHWDADGKYLFGPRPREWSYADWFRQILEAAAAQDWRLLVTNSTRWRGISDELKAELTEVAAVAGGADFDPPAA